MTNLTIVTNVPLRGDVDHPAGTTLATIESELPTEALAAGLATRNIRVGPPTGPDRRRRELTDAVSGETVGAIESDRAPSYLMTVVGQGRADIVDESNQAAEDEPTADQVLAAARVRKAARSAVADAGLATVADLIRAASDGTLQSIEGLTQTDLEKITAAID